MTILIQKELGYYVGSVFPEDICVQAEKASEIVELMQIAVEVEKEAWASRKKP